MIEIKTTKEISDIYVLTPRPQDVKILSQIRNKEWISKESLIKYLKEKRNYHHNLLEVRQRNVIENILKELEKEK